MLKLKQKNKKAFTLVETLIAIAILVTTIVAPLTIAANSLFQARYSRDQVVATYLAQEAIEMIRYIRDRNMMKALGSPQADWLEFIPRDKWFSPDWTTAQKGNLQLCPNVNDPESCPYLSYNGAYSLNPTAASSHFKRAVKISVDPNFPDEIVVESRVFWTSGVSGERSIGVRTHLYNWAVVEN